MEERFKEFEKTLKKKHSFNFTPKYKEEFTTVVNKLLFVAIAEKVVEKLGWDLVYKDENTIEAKRGEKRFGSQKWTEMITASYEFGKVIVLSESLGNEYWDNGRNSKRVKLFIYAFQEILKTYDSQTLGKLQKEIERQNNWDDYIIPETLPKPLIRKKPNITLPIISGLFIAFILGFILAFISLKGVYVIILFEFIIAVAIALSMKLLIRLSNYSDFNKLQFLLFGIVILVFASNQYFQYEIILFENNYDRFGFWKFLRLRFSEGFIIEKINTGWIGLLISWVLQIGLTVLFLYIKIVSILADYTIEKVPNEVIDFVYYYLVKEKSEEEIRTELAKKDWTDKNNQDEVFEAIGGLNSLSELNRIK